VIGCRPITALTPPITLLFDLRCPMIGGDYLPIGGAPIAL
jgi:hypothetical protein